MAGLLAGLALAPVALADPDVDAPSLTALSCTPNSVDIGEVAAMVTCTATLSDAASGVQGFVLQLRSPSQISRMSTCSSMAPATGDRSEGTFVCHGSIAQDVETGTWVVTQVDVGDTAGNSRSYSHADLVQMEISPSISVAD
jgi:hypothetical protein